MFLLNFDRSGQRDFFAKLGLKNVNQNLLLSVSLLLLLFFFLWVRVSTRRGQKVESAVQKAYLDLRGRLSKKGIDKESYEGPSDFLERAQAELPEQQENLEEFRQIYLLAHYGEIEQKGQIQAVLKKIR